MATLSALICCAESKQRFKNTHIDYSNDIGKFWSIAKAYWNDERTNASPKIDLPIERLSASELKSDHSDAVFRLGHSSVLLRLDGELILLDPVFAQRASPVQWIGPKRFHPVPISAEELPTIKAVVISHDHYDHLDKQTIQELSTKVEHFITPLKVGERLKRWGISASRVIELNWWQSINVGGLQIIATPSQHFSGRGILDKDKTLWASWVIKSSKRNVYFSGDSGYFPGFKRIGERYGPFDITLIETGAYNDLWSDIHMLPKQSLQAHIDLKGKVMIPIHNSTFDLALHNWFEPLEIIHNLANTAGVNLATPVFGQKYRFDSVQETETWWRNSYVHASTDTQLHHLSTDSLDTQK